VVGRKKILHHRQLYLDRPDPISFIPVAVDTSDHIYDDFLRLLFLHAHSEASDLGNEIPGGIGHFHFLRAVRLVNIKGSVGLILAKAPECGDGQGVVSHVITDILISTNVNYNRTSTDL